MSSEHNSGNKTLFGVLAYLGPLVIISFLVEKDNPFVKFHIKQGLVIFCIEILLSVLSSMLWPMWSLYGLYRLIHLALLVLSIIGIINVVKNREKELPVVGGLARYFTF